MARPRLTRTSRNGRRCRTFRPWACSVTRNRGYLGVYGVKVVLRPLVTASHTVHQKCGSVRFHPLRPHRPRHRPHSLLLLHCHPVPHPISPRSRTEISTGMSKHAYRMIPCTGSASEAIMGKWHRGMLARWRSWVVYSWIDTNLTPKYKVGTFPR